MVGTLGKSDNFNLVMGTGINATGLSKLYFDSLSTRLASFVNDLTLGTKSLDLIANHDYLEHDRKPTYAATYDTLSGNKNVREKAIILGFCTALVSICKDATHLSQLQNEANDPTKSPLLEILAAKRGPGMLSSKEATSLSTYKKELQKKIGESAADHSPPSPKRKRPGICKFSTTRK